MRIDHVIYGTSDLVIAAQRIESELGFRAVGGGRHEGIGTHNQIVSFEDGTFIELLAIADPDEARGSPVGAALQAAISCVTGLVESLKEPYLPFFIERLADRKSEVSANRAVGIAWVEVAGNSSRLAQWLDKAERPVRIVDGDAAVRAVGVGERELRNHSPATRRCTFP